jgi:hypothetical protein
MTWPAPSKCPRPRRRARCSLRLSQPPILPPAILLNPGFAGISGLNPLPRRSRSLKEPNFFASPRGIRVTGPASPVGFRHFRTEAANHHLPF